MVLRDTEKGSKTEIVELWFGNSKKPQWPHRNHWCKQETRSWAASLHHRFSVSIASLPKHTCVHIHAHPLFRNFTIVFKTEKRKVNLNSARSSRTQGGEMRMSR